MQVSDEDLHEFIRLYKEEFGEEISMEDASAMAEKLVVFYEHILNLPSESDSEGETA